MHALTGYADRWSARPGETVRFMISSAADRDFALRFVRHICADPNPKGPGYQEVAMPTPADGTRAGKQQPAWLGSFGRAASLPVDLQRGIRLSATIWPTTPRKGRQGLIALRIGDATISLGIGSHGGAQGELVTADGTAIQAEVPQPLLERRWYNVSASLHADGSLTVKQTPHAPLGDAGEAEIQAMLPPSGKADVFLAALPPEGTEPARCHYNGKLEHPAIHRPDGPLATWNFSLNIPTQIATDTGPHAAHARLLNLPTRAMTGSNWTGAVHDWKAAPDQYGAIHFHDDDQGPLGWSEAASLQVPADWPSGFYAAHIKQRSGRGLHPVHRPPAPAAARMSRCWCRHSATRSMAASSAPAAARKSHRARRRLGLAAANARHEPAIRAVLLQPSQRWVRRIVGHPAFRPMLDTTAATVLADGSDRRRLRHRALGRRQLLSTNS